MSITNEKYGQDTIKIVEGFCLFDDNFMSMVFERNIPATEFLIKVILQRDDMKVIEVVGQREYKSPEIGGRSIRIDISLKLQHLLWTLRNTKRICNNREIPHATFGIALCKFGILIVQ